MQIKLASHLFLASIFITLGLVGCGQENSSSTVSPRRGATPGPLEQQATSPSTDNHQHQSQQQASTSTELLPPTSDIAPIRPVPGVAVAYDFKGTLARESSTAAAARMILQSSNLKSAKKLKVKGTIVNLRSSSQKQPFERDVDVLDGGIIDFTVQNLKPDTVYRIEGISLSDISQNSQSAANITLKDPYFLATISDSKLSKARRRLALEALSEAYDWDHNNYDAQKGYARGWGWCDYFYTWSASREFKVRAGYGSTSFFRNYNSLGNANQIPAIAENDSMAGDLIRYEGTREGTHTFMIIAYDVDTKSLWNVEGNYNSRVMRSQRKISSNWMHGHLTEEQVK